MQGGIKKKRFAAQIQIGYFWLWYFKLIGISFGDKKFGFGDFRITNFHKSLSVAVQIFELAL